MTISFRPLIKSDERISRIRLSGSLHRKHSVAKAISTRHVVATTKVRIDHAARNLDNPSRALACTGACAITTAACWVRKHWGRINDGHGGDGITAYREYDSAGVEVPNGLVIDLANYGFSTGTGVALGPDNASLYFVANVNDASGQVLVRFDLAGNLIDFQPINPTPNGVIIMCLEDIDSRCTLTRL